MYPGLFTSFLQKTEVYSKGATKVALLSQLENMLLMPSGEDADKLRSAVDNIAALLDKFPVGKCHFIYSDS